MPKSNKLGLKNRCLSGINGAKKLVIIWTIELFEYFRTSPSSHNPQGVTLTGEYNPDDY